MNSEINYHTCHYDMIMYQGLKGVFVKDSEKRVAPMRLLKCDWMKAYTSTDLSTPPTPMKRFLFKFTLISRMVLKIEKNSEIRENSEDFNPCVRNLKMKVLYLFRASTDSW